MRPINNRDGASLVAVLALMAVCSAILLPLLSSSLRQRIQLRRDLQHEQTQWLLRAGMRYAAVEGDAEHVDLSAGIDVEIPHFDAARLTIAAESNTTNASTVKVSAQIGQPESPTQMTVLSSRLKLPALNSKSNHE